MAQQRLKQLVSPGNRPMDLGPPLDLLPSERSSLEPDGRALSDQQILAEGDGWGARIRT